MASMACVKWCQTSPSWPAGKWELLCCWSQGQQYPVLSGATQPPCWALLHRRATVSLGGKGWRPGAMKEDKSLSLFSCICWKQVQTDLSCPAPAPMKAHLVSVAHSERHSLHPSGAALHYPVPGRTWCWAAWNAVLGCSRPKQAPATPAQSMASRPLLSAPACPNRS